MLPAVIQEIVRCIGHAPAMALVHEFGGQELRIPQGEGNDVWAALAEVIGEANTRRLTAAMGGNRIYIALCTAALRADRNRRMILRYEALLREGHRTGGAIAILTREFRPICYRQVEQVVNAPLPEASGVVVQGCLF